MICGRCKERGKTWKGDSPKCGFPNGEFSSENWNCATLNAIRDIAEQTEVWSEDQYAAVLPWDGRYLVLSWYKHRGRTEGAWILDSSTFTPLSLVEAEDFIEAGQRQATPSERSEAASHV